MKTIHNIGPDFTSSEIETIDSNRTDHENIFSTPSILMEDEQETKLYDYRFMPHLLMEFDSDSAHGHQAFYEIHEPSNIFYHYSKANDRSDTSWVKYQNTTEKKEETYNSVDSISMSVFLYYREEQDIELEELEHQFISYFFMGSMNDSEKYYNNTEEDSEDS